MLYPTDLASFLDLIRQHGDVAYSLLFAYAASHGMIMALSHRDLPVHGVQFHPESIASEHGATILRNFLDLAERWSRETSKAALSATA